MIVVMIPRSSCAHHEGVGRGRCSSPSLLVLLLVLVLSAAGGTDPVTAATDLCAHVRIAPNLRNAALNLVGADLYKKIKPPGDTSLYS